MYSSSAGRPPIRQTTMQVVLCKAIKVLLEQRGLTLKQVSSVCKTSPRTLSRILDSDKDTHMDLNLFHTLMFSVLRLTYADLESLKKVATASLGVYSNIRISEFPGALKFPRATPEEVEEAVEFTLIHWGIKNAHIPTNRSRDFDNLAYA